MVLRVAAIWMTSFSPGTEVPVTPTTTDLHMLLQTAMHIVAADSPILSMAVKNRNHVPI
jgi:putative N-acetylmannosamine-6-phosphate epimerase